VSRFIIEKGIGIKIFLELVNIIMNSLFMEMFSSSRSRGNSREQRLVACYEFGADSVGVSQHLIPNTPNHLTNYPNPFNPSTTIAFNISEPGRVTIDIFNIRGQKVKTLMDCTTTQEIINVCGMDEMMPGSERQAGNIWQS
jgi:hypothetical protein